MRTSYVSLLLLLGCAIPLGASNPDRAALQIRQDSATAGSDTDLPNLTTNSPTTTTEAASTSSKAITSSAAQTTEHGESSQTTAASSTQKSTTQSPATTASAPTATNTLAGNATSPSSEATTEDNLPWEPTITPALGIAGVFLIVLGSIYALIGVKSRWVQIFLSTGFLASVATAALVEYVMHPPLTNAIQGGFFVAILMTGVIFGAGALVFKEFTEGFGCLLGGFTFSMWLLTLKAGGLITNQIGKGIFIGIFCILAWALSLSSYTRPYALIGSTSFSGATAFVLGIDCFTRAGMKEFWFYIWDLNDDLFPLGTTTFPLTRGMRVEIAVLVIGTIIGVLSQIKLWKVIRTKEMVVEADQEEIDRQQEAIDAALGRHLQRQNDREKTQWERQYGDRLQSKRNTVLWQDAHPEKRYSSVSVVALEPTSVLSSAESLEMNAFGPKRISGYGSKNKRQSSLAVDVIEEIEEDPEVIAEAERRKALQALEEVDTSVANKAASKGNQKAKGSPTSYQQLYDQESSGPRKSKDLPTRKRDSQQPRSGLAKRLSQSNIGASASESNENLLDVERPYSRASSVAATLDEANEILELPNLEHEEDDVRSPPEIVISPIGSDDGKSRNAGIQLAVETTKAPIQPREASELASDSTALNEGLGSSSVSLTEIAEKDASQSNKDYSQSQVTEESNSTADSLTALALASIPSQLSNVVLSYRTNEWAKHISVAEIPICEEPEAIAGNDTELPTQLAKPIPEAEKKAAATVAAIEVPPPELLPPTVKASNGGVGIAVNPVSAQRSFSDPDRRPSPSLSTVNAPSRTASMQSLKLPGHRNSRNSFSPGSTTSLVTTPIDENVPTVFAASKSPSRRVSTGPYMMPSRQLSSSSLTNSAGPRPHTSQTPSNPYHNNSTVSLPQSVRPASQQMSSSMGTRLDSYDSRQPPRKESTRPNAERRESLLAEWRLSQQQRTMTNGTSGVAVENSRAQMQAERETRRMTEEYKKREQQRKQQSMDQAMRRPDMQDAHREAMRRMQAGANNTLRNSSA
ncbi:hypothetical protein LTR84_000579 [Exophiala bonariae]|uniref:TM7S3/TM198-like domain-containing protein n=1 Tax=Exophiala bonariae TaxID=1690606 RepID=A0AAV9NTJ0_9EURO|nr:hypothetical protein LTR84_000579 [Exophiala bonariae]